MTGGPVAGGTVITLGGYGFRNFDEYDTALGKARCGWGDNDTIVPIAIVTASIAYRLTDCAASSVERGAERAIERGRRN